jgi:hypothetical protein
MKFEKQCGSCVYWMPRFYSREVGRLDRGNCHRHAPVTMIAVRSALDDSAPALWPEVLAEQSCGDYECKDVQS